VGLVGSRALVRSCVREYLNTLLARPPKEGSLVEGAAVGKSSTIRLDQPLARQQRIEKLGVRCLPSYPGISMIPEVIVGTPALLTTDCNDGGLSHVRMLASAYRSVCHYKHDFSCLFMLNGDPTCHERWSLLLKASGKMLVAKIPPVAWVQFSFDVWSDTIDEDSAPTVAWTFSLTRLKNRVDWFEAFKDQYCIRRTSVGPKHQQLILDWQEMWHRLHQADPRTRDELVAIVEDVFPDDSFELRVASARVEVRRLQVEVDRLLAEGGELWI
jgi:hypothetical protein